MTTMDNEFSRELIKHLTCFYKKRYLLLAVFVLVTTVSLLFSYQVPKKYEAGSTVFIEENVIKDLVKGIAVTPDMESRVNAIKFTLLGREFLSRVLKSLDIDLGIVDDFSLNELVADLQERTTIYIRGDKGKSNLFKVSIVDKNPSFAQKYINGLVQTFVEENISSTREETYGANRFLDEQLAMFKSKLDKAENAIIELRKNQGIYSAVSESALLADITAYDRSIEELDLSIDTLRGRQKRFESQKASIDQTVTLSNTKQVQNRIGMLEQKIAQLMLTYTESYPEIVMLKAELESLKANPAQEVQSGDQSPDSTTMLINPLFQEIQQKMLDTEAEIAALSARRNKFKALKAQKEQQLQNIPENKKELMLLTQERDSYKNIYEQLLMRMGKSEVSTQMEIGDKTTTFRVIDPAILPVKPVSPNMVRMILLSLAIGLGSSVGLILLIDRLDNSMKNVQQLMELGIEVLAVVPNIVDETTRLHQKRKDLLGVAVAGVYVVGVFGLLGFEYLRSTGSI
jgi:polysaccharide chain length determinant protein (PEP-CTERM system associated)